MSSGDLDKLIDNARRYNTDREVLRRKVLMLLDKFRVDGFERGIALSRFEGAIKQASDADVAEVLRILRE